jgi:hypothetical protein
MPLSIVEEPDTSQDTIIVAPLTRRLVVKASLSVGFGAAISPVMAQVITTRVTGSSPAIGRKYKRAAAEASWSQATRWLKEHGA